MSLKKSRKFAMLLRRNPVLNIRYQWWRLDSWQQTNNTLLWKLGIIGQISLLDIDHIWATNKRKYPSTTTTTKIPSRKTRGPHTHRRNCNAVLQLSKEFMPVGDKAVVEEEPSSSEPSIPPHLTHVHRHITYTQYLHNFTKDHIYWVNLSIFLYLWKSKVHILIAHFSYNLFLKLATIMK